MKITTATFDIGDGIEELDIQKCSYCEIIYVDSVECKVIVG